VRRRWFFPRGANDQVVAGFNADDLALALRDKGVIVENRLYPDLGTLAGADAVGPFRWRAPLLEDR